MRRLDASHQDHAVGGEVAEIDGAAAIGAGNDRAQARRPALLRRDLIEAHLGEPPDQVAAAVAARQAAVPSDREIDAAAGLQQFLGNLRARRAGAGDQHRARRKLSGILVVGGMDLEHGMIAQQVRDEVALIGTGGDDDIVRRDRAVGGLGDETCAVTLRQPRHRDAAADRGADEAGIGLDEFDDVVRVGKGIRIAVRKRKVRQPHRPVGKLEFQPVPAFAAPALGDPVALEHEVRKPALLQPVAHHEASLAAADHQRFDFFIRHVSGPCGAWRVLPPRG